MAERFEPSACPRSERRNACDLRNIIYCDSLGFPRFVPKCAQNVPTADLRTRRVARNMFHILQTVKELTDWGVTLVPLPTANGHLRRSLAHSKACE